MPSAAAALARPTEFSTPAEAETEAEAERSFPRCTLSSPRSREERKKDTEGAANPTQSFAGPSRLSAACAAATAAVDCSASFDVVVNVIASPSPSSCVCFAFRIGCVSDCPGTTTVRARRSSLNASRSSSDLCMESEKDNEPKSTELDAWALPQHNGLHC